MHVLSPRDDSAAEGRMCAHVCAERRKVWRRKRDARCREAVALVHHGLGGQQRRLVGHLAADPQASYRILHTAAYSLHGCRRLWYTR